MDFNERVIPGITANFQSGNKEFCRKCINPFIGFLILRLLELQYYILIYIVSF